MLLRLLLVPSVLLWGWCNCGDDIFFPTDDTKYVGSGCETATGLRGICLKVSECLDSVERLASKDLCSFDRSEPIYCCPVDFIVNADVRFDAIGHNSSSSSNKKSSSKGNSNVNQVEISTTNRIPVVSRPLEQICNRFYPNQVRGGRDNKVQENNDSSLDSMEPPPFFMTSIGWTEKDGLIIWKCTGVLIAEKIILTEASCIQSESSSPSWARIETLNKSGTRSRKILNISSVYTHPDYKSPEISHNLGIVKIDTDDSLAESIKPACLTATDDLSAGQLVRWGFMNHSTNYGIFSKNISLLNDQVCMEKIGNNADLSAGGLFCGDLKEICEEDAGGPVLFYATGAETSRPYIVGMTTFGRYCDTLNPIAYTRLSYYLDWIEPFLIREV